MPPAATEAGRGGHYYAALTGAHRDIYGGAENTLAPTGTAYTGLRMIRGARRAQSARADRGDAASQGERSSRHSYMPRR